MGRTGAALGVLAGLLETTLGASIREVIGGKENPVALGVVTLFLSAVALTASEVGRSAEPRSTNAKLAVVLGQLLPAVICFTTVGYLWFVPGPLLLLSTALLVYRFLQARPVDNRGVEEDDRSVAGASSLSRLGRILAFVGSVVVVGSIGLALLSPDFSPYLVEGTVDGVAHRYAVAPVDSINHVAVAEYGSTKENIESSAVRLAYVLLLVGGSMSLIASVAGSRLFVIVGGGIVVAGSILLVGSVPNILAAIGRDSQVLTGAHTQTLWVGWYAGLAGGLLTVLGSLVSQEGRDQQRLSAKPGN